MKMKRKRLFIVLIVILTGIFFALLAGKNRRFIMNRPKIKLEINTSSWNKWRKPYDIERTIKKKLKGVGFQVVGSNASVYDARLKVMYSEGKGKLYIIQPNLSRLGSPSKLDVQGTLYGTLITCQIELQSIDGKALFSKTITGGTDSNFKIEGNSISSEYCYELAVQSFEGQFYYKYLCELLATRFGKGDEISILLSAFDDADHVSTSTKNEIVKDLGDVKAIEPLVAVLLKDLNGFTRAYAAYTLGRIGDAEAVDALLSVLNDPDVRLSAISALGRIGDVRAVEPLISALKVNNPRVRKRAANALGEIGDERAIEPLKAVLKDEDFLVREEAREALHRIGNQPENFRPEIGSKRPSKNSVIRLFRRRSGKPDNLHVP